jgi:hypothetical protein
MNNLATVFETEIDDFRGMLCRDIHDIHEIDCESIEWADDIFKTKLVELINEFEHNAITFEQKLINGELDN